MTSVLEKPLMAKHRGRPRGDRDDVSVKLERAIVNKARLIAAHEGIPGGIAELLSEILRGPIDKRYAKMVHDLDRAGGL